MLWYTVMMTIIPFCILFVLDSTRRNGDPPRLGGFVVRLALLGIIGSYGWGVGDLMRDDGVTLKDAIIGGAIFAAVVYIGAWLPTSWLVDWFRRHDSQPTAVGPDPAGEPASE